GSPPPASGPRTAESPAILRYRQSRGEVEIVCRGCDENHRSLVRPRPRLPEQVGSAKMQSRQAAERAERVLQEARKAIEDFETENPQCRLEAALKIIELSERYGSLKERMSMLM